jgi:hypothetical protein
MLNAETGLFVIGCFNKPSCLVSNSSDKDAVRVVYVTRFVYLSLICSIFNIFTP